MSEYDLDFIWLAHGAHPLSEDGCLMEWVALLAGLDKTDHPGCTNTLVAGVAIHLNDSLDPYTRQGLKRLIPQLVRARRTAADDHVDRQLALWCARSMPEPDRDRPRAAHGAALRAATAYLDGRITEDECRTAAAVAAEVGAQLRSVVLYVAADAAAAAVEDDPEPAIVNAVAGAADWAIRTGIPVEWLSRLLNAHRALVGAEELACCPG